MFSRNHKRSSRTRISTKPTMEVDYRLKSKSEDQFSRYSAGCNTKQKPRQSNQMIFSSRGNIVHPLELTNNSNRKLERKAGPSSSAMKSGIETAGARSSSVWKTAIDKKSGKTYYYNSVTMKSTWEKVSFSLEVYLFLFKLT